MVECFKTFQSLTTTISFPVEEPTETVAAPKEVSNQVEADVAPETEPALVDKRTDKSDKKSTHVPTAEEEEIDDVEPGEDEDLVEEIFCGTLNALNVLCYCPLYNNFSLK